MGGEARQAGKRHTYMIAGVQTASPTVGVLSVNACRKPADSDRNGWARRPGARMRRTHHAWRVASCVRGVPDSMHDAGLCAPERGRTMAGGGPAPVRSKGKRPAAPAEALEAQFPRVTGPAAAPM